MSTTSSFGTSEVLAKTLNMKIHHSTPATGTDTYVPIKSAQCA